VLVRDWTRTNRTWFDAVQIEKRMMGIILTLIVAVAAFNLVSHAGDDGDRQAAPTSPSCARWAPARAPSWASSWCRARPAASSARWSGVGWACCVAFNIDVIVPAIERLLGVAFLPGSIYLISRMPSDPRGRHRADRAGLAGCWPSGHAVPELARQPHQPGRGAAL
jgi:lipoprotein-releasing system permease protein